MKTNVKKSIISAAFMLAICSVCLTANANPVITSLSDTGKMAKMKMAKPNKMKKKKMDKMSKDKMSKDKMGKDTSKM